MDSLLRLLTPSQTTNLRQFQIESADNFKFDENDRKLSKREESTVGKKRNCLPQTKFEKERKKKHKKNLQEECKLSLTS